ncbi:hypothetical protein [Desulfobacter latus]|nr:hypothetical protein [Desulfobacter latus]
MTQLLLTILFMMTLVIGVQILALFRERRVWERILAFSSISSKAAVLALAVSVMREDWMIAVVAVIVLSAGNAGIMLLSHLLNRLNVQ